MSLCNHYGGTSFLWNKLLFLQNYIKKSFCSPLSNLYIYFFVFHFNLPLISSRGLRSQVTIFSRVYSMKKSKAASYFQYCSPGSASKHNCSRYSLHFPDCHWSVLKDYPQRITLAWRPISLQSEKTEEGCVQGATEKNHWQKGKTGKSF